ncbi:Protein kinase domain protein [Legionella massiliensis]|uniref:Protein kinase domain protein n=2 Tax=Bacteria TaxID=2 RepID=A0A078KZ24_9GAMM|nr:hypothetical protein [Legionella massiliensis]CDZ76948.1 Protein kinase domain protein [Legionella massiliensis]CEE12686.1 Protein kinase domain protein [Legionella massiliensis]
MLVSVQNPRSDPRIEKLNIKIQMYNEISEDLPYEKKLTQKALLLEEINYMANFFKNKIKDSKMSAHTVFGLYGLYEFPGISREIASLSGIDTAAYNSEIQLIQLSKAREKIEDVFEAIQRRGPYTKDDTFNEVFNAFETLSLQKLDADGSQAQQEAYYYNLIKFKEFLLNKLAFETPEPSSNTEHFQKMLASVNYELQACILSIPHLKREYTEQLYSEETLMTLSSKIESFTLVQLRQANALLRSNPPTEENISELRQLLFADSPHIQLTRLGGANNANWKISDELTGREYLLRAADPVPNQAALRQLSLGPMQQFFAKDYLSTIPELAENPCSISISEFIPDGDLYTQRSNMGEAPDPNELTRQAINTISQLTQIGQHLLASNCAHTDIKLTNFLIRDGQVKISDTKGILKCNENKRFRTLEVTTKIYAPPEARPQEGYSGEAFMSYQIGLALYDYLVQPPSTSPAWSEKHPLDYSHPYFSTPQGETMQGLISSMTDPNPENRLSLSEAQETLGLIQDFIMEQAPAPVDLDLPELPVVPDALPYDFLPGLPFEAEHDATQIFQRFEEFSRVERVIEADDPSDAPVETENVTAEISQPISGTNEEEPAAVKDADEEENEEEENEKNSSNSLRMR